MKEALSFLDDIVNRSREKYMMKHVNKLLGSLNDQNNFLKISFVGYNFETLFLLVFFIHICVQYQPNLACQH